MPAIRKAIIERPPVPSDRADFDALSSLKLTEDLTMASCGTVNRGSSRSKGVDYMTIIPAGCANRAAWCASEITESYSRGGAMLAAIDKRATKKRSCCTSMCDEISKSSKPELSFSLGDGFASGMPRRMQRRREVRELKVLGELTTKAWEHDVQVVIEVPALPIDQNRNAG